MTTPNLTDLVQYVRAYDNDRGDRAQLHKLFPYLEGWYNAAQYLQRLHVEAFWAERGGFDPWSTVDPGEDAGYVALMAEYSKCLDEISRGERQPIIDES